MISLIIPDGRSFGLLCWSGLPFQLWRAISIKEQNSFIKAKTADTWTNNRGNILGTNRHPDSQLQLSLIKFEASSFFNVRRTLISPTKDIYTRMGLLLLITATGERVYCVNIGTWAYLFEYIVAWRTVVMQRPRDGPIYHGRFCATTR
jgi:hypothetical protein